MLGTARIVSIYKRLFRIFGMGRGTTQVANTDSVERNYEKIAAVYKRLGPIRFRMNHQLVKSLDKKTIEDAGRELGLLRRGTLVFDNEAEMDVLMDYGIYNHLRGGRNAVRKFLEESPPARDSDDLAVLLAMSHAYYSVFQVVDTERARGVGLTVLDLLRGDTLFLADINFSNTAPKGALLAGRVIPWDDFFMTSGAQLPVTPAVLARIQHELARIFKPGTDFHELTPEQEAKLAALTIRMCLSAGTSSRIAFADPGEHVSASPRGFIAGTTEPARPRANRNDPCPCGSGRKFKTCCGKR